MWDVVYDHCKTTGQKPFLTAMICWKVSCLGSSWSNLERPQEKLGGKPARTQKQRKMIEVSAQFFFLCLFACSYLLCRFGIHMIPDSSDLLASNCYVSSWHFKSSDLHLLHVSYEACHGMAPAFAILASNDAAAKVASKNSAAAGVQLFQPLGWHILTCHTATPRYIYIYTALGLVLIFVYY